MDQMHEPSPEFTRYLEWQTRTEVRRRARFGVDERASRGGLRVAGLAAVVCLSLMIGGCAVFTVERVQDERAVQGLIESNRVEAEFAQRALEFAQSALDRATQRYETGVANDGAVLEARQRVEQLQRDLDQLVLEGEELAARKRPVEERITASAVGSRDFVAERLELERVYLAAERARRDELLQRARVMVDMGLQPSGTVQRAQLEAFEAASELEQLDRRLQLRHDYLAGEIDAVECERTDRALDAEYRRDRAEQALIAARAELERAQLMARKGMISSDLSEQTLAVERLDTELQLATYELEAAGSR